VSIKEGIAELERCGRAEYDDCIGSSVVSVIVAA
jgi:hypothetical protein